LLAATISLSVSAATDLSSPTGTVERGKPTKEQILDRAQAPGGADSCNFSIDEKGVKRTATEQQQKACKTANESRSNALRAADPTPQKPK
jgi:hypothetical protein